MTNLKKKNRKNGNILYLDLATFFYIGKRLSYFK